MTKNIPGVVLWLRSLFVFDNDDVDGAIVIGTANFEMGIIRVWCHVTVFLSVFEASHGIDQRLIWLSASKTDDSPFTSPAAASDHRLWPFNGNNGKFNGLREQRWNGAFIPSKWPGFGNGPRMFSKKLCIGLGPRISCGEPLAPAISMFMPEPWGTGPGPIPPPQLWSDDEPEPNRKFLASGPVCCWWKLFRSPFWEALIVGPKCGDGVCERISLDVALRKEKQFKQKN